MAETHNPLKRLLQAAIEDFAAWLLAAEIHEVQTVNVGEHPDLHSKP